MPALHLAAFRVDASVPLGHPLCGGWITPAKEIVEPLLALGVVLLGEEAPVVLCAVDWTGICNDAHSLFCERLARAAHTTPDRVAVHCVHQHNAPFVDLAAQKILDERQSKTPICDVQWFTETVDRVAATVKTALAKAEKVTALAIGQGKVEKVASNRRVIGPDGTLLYWRGSSCRNEKAIAEPEGLIDPLLKTLSFWNGDKKLAALHYYATHPMSYYGDGLVNSDFVGLARERRTKEDKTLHIYFTGCAGNVAAGKYNTGAKENRAVLADRVHAGMVASEEKPERLPAGMLSWRVEPVVLPPRSDATEEELLKLIADGEKATAIRNRSAMKLSYRRRAVARQPILLSALHLHEKACLLHMPAESFIEFQLFAQEKRPGGWVATAAYGDGGPWYIPIAKAYPQGGYEPSVAFVDPESEALLNERIAKLVKPA